MINKNTRPGSTVWHVRNVGLFVSRFLHFKDDQDRINWIIRECKIIERAPDSHYDYPGHFWIDFVCDDSCSPHSCASPFSLFPSFRTALDHVSSELQLEKQRAEKELSKICTIERMISSRLTKEIDND